MINRNQLIFENAKEYLLSIDDVSEEMIDGHLNEWKLKNPTNMNGLFKEMILHAKNRQGMPNTIGDVEKLNKVLYGFNPKKVLSNYASWKQLFDEIKNDTYKPPGRMRKSNPKSYWVIFCKSIISIANFLRSYHSVEEFNSFVKGFYTNEYSRLALPLLLEKEIYGFGFALSCDFLKDTGYPEFIKPDTHIHDIALGIGITKSEDQYNIFKDVILYCRSIGKLPYEVDKLFWLIGSGNFYLYKKRVNTSKWDFIEKVKNI